MGCFPPYNTLKLINLLFFLSFVSFLTRTMSPAQQSRSPGFVEDIGVRHGRVRFVRTSDGARKSDKVPRSRIAQKQLDSIAVKVQRKAVQTLKNIERSKAPQDPRKKNIWEDQTVQNCATIKKNPTGAALPSDLVQNPFVIEGNPYKRRENYVPRDKILREDANTLWKQDRTGKLLTVNNNMISLAPLATSYNPPETAVEKALVLEKEMQKKDIQKKKKKQTAEKNSINKILSNYQKIRNSTGNGFEIEAESFSPQDRTISKTKNVKNENDSENKEISIREKPTKLTEKQRKKLREERAKIRKRTEASRTESTDKHVKFAISNIEQEANKIKKMRAKEITKMNKFNAVDSQVRRLNRLDMSYLGKEGNKGGTSGMKGVVRTSSLFRDIMFGLNRTGAYMKNQGGQKKTVKKKKASKGRYRLVKDKRKGLR